MIGILTALLSGALMSVQGVFNTQVTKATSLWVSTSFVQFTALLVCLVIWYFADGKSLYCVEFRRIQQNNPREKSPKYAKTRLQAVRLRLFSVFGFCVLVGLLCRGRDIADAV